MVFIKVYLNQVGSRIKSQQKVNKPKKTNLMRRIYNEFDSDTNMNEHCEEGRKEKTFPLHLQNVKLVKVEFPYDLFVEQYALLSASKQAAEHPYLQRKVRVFEKQQKEEETYDEERIEREVLLTLLLKST